MINHARVTLGTPARHGRLIAVRYYAAVMVGAAGLALLL